ncbi:MAG TPA: hypothetical protein VHQ20_01085 [Patescibacteria group bacterium]|jgi:phosphoribosylaminoimidazolecarboxamide formyltransferase/IMP cyclohydrolase|nr:hypothetical protein [Patescibacteria group bacterium]
MSDRQKYALISVANKDGIVEFAIELVALGWSIISSGGTGEKLREAKIPVVTVSELRAEIFRIKLRKLGWTILDGIGDPVLPGRAFEQFCPTEMLGHRVATLHAEVHGGILAAEDMLEELDELGYPLIDLVCVDCYDLESALKEPDLTLRKALDKIDIGGPTMICGAAKNLRIVVIDVLTRDWVIDMLKQSGDVPLPDRMVLAAEAFDYVSEYRFLAAEYLHAQAGVTFMAEGSKE